MSEIPQAPWDLIHTHLTQAVAAQLRHWDGTEPCKRWPEDRIEQVAAEAVQNAMHAIGLYFDSATARLQAIADYCQQKADEHNAEFGMAVWPQDMRVNAGDILAIIDREQS